MNLEEILVKIGLDGNGLDKGLRTASVGLKNFGEHASEHMDKAAKSGRALHGFLSEIGSISPGVGLALTACFSGPMAALELLKMGIESIKEHFAEAKKVAAEAEAAFARSMALTGDPRERARSVRGEVAGRTRETGYEPSKEEIKDLRDIEDKTQAIKKQEFELEEIRKKEVATRQGAADAESELLAMTSEERRYGPVRVMELQKQVTEHDALLKKVNEQDKALNAQKDALMDLTQADKDRLDSAKEFEKIAEANATKEIERKKKLAEENEKLDRQDEQAKERLNERIKKQADLEATQARQRKELAQLSQSPYTPSTSDLAKYNTPYGELARIIQAREGQAKFASAHASPQELAGLRQGFQANSAQLRSDLQAAGNNPLAVKAALERSAEGLRGMLGEHGNDPHLRALEKMKDDMAELKRKATQEGLIVQPPPDQ